MSDLKVFWQEQMNDHEFAEYADQMQARREVADAIFKTRADRKMSQTELAKLSGVSQGDISRFENEEKDINLNTLDKIARAMGCRVQIRFVEFEPRDEG